MALSQKEYAERFYRKRKENGLCPRCGRELDRIGHYCSICLIKIRTEARLVRQFYKDNGFCTQCRKTNCLAMKKPVLNV